MRAVRILSRVGLPWRPAVRPQAGAALGALHRCPVVALGTLFSAFWILAANSWMQTPAGYSFVDGRFYPHDWLQIIFNPSFPYRFAHTVVGFYVTAGFVVLGVGAYTIRRRRFLDEGRVMVTTALSLLVVLVPLQMIIGDQHGLNTRKYQPAKIARSKRGGRPLPACR